MKILFFKVTFENRALLSLPSLPHFLISKAVEHVKHNLSIQATYSGELRKVSELNKLVFGIDIFSIFSLMLQLHFMPNNWTLVSSFVESLSMFTGTQVTW